MEIFDLYDDDFNMLEKKMYRGNSNEPGEYHLVVHIWIKNKKGEFLIQQRNKTTDRIPYQWACTAGAATTGDTSLDAAVRETHEELGILIDRNKFKSLRKFFVPDQQSNYVVDVFMVEEDILLKDVIIDKVEVRDATYKTLNQIKEMVDRNEFWDFANNICREEYIALLEKSEI